MHAAEPHSISKTTETRKVSRPNTWTTQPWSNGLGQTQPAELGTWAWAEQTGGSLSARDKRGMWNLVVRAELSRPLEALIARVWGQRPDLERVPVPGTQLADAAQTLCERVATPELLGHCLRTYTWGSLLGQQARLTYDPEVLFIASMLHTLGLTTHAPTSQEVPCHAVCGARAALNFLRAEGMREERAQVVADCISLHLNPYVQSSYHPNEAWLLAEGSALDAIGARKRAISSRVRGAVLRQHPRRDFSLEYGFSLDSQVRAWPGTRLEFLVRHCRWLQRLHSTLA